MEKKEIKGLGFEEMGGSRVLYWESLELRMSRRHHHAIGFGFLISFHFPLLPSRFPMSQAGRPAIFGPYMWAA